MFNFHTYLVDDVPCLLNSDVMLSLDGKGDGVRLSVGLHPWYVGADWQERVRCVRAAAMSGQVWAIGECGLDKARGVALQAQLEAFGAQVAIAEEVGKPMVIHCVRAFDELLAVRKRLEEACSREGRTPQPWVIHGFRGKPEQAKQLMAKGMLFSFGHQYNLETLRFVFISSRPFYLETDDLHLSVRHIYEQVAHHLGVDVSHLEHLCDPRQTIFHQMAF